MHSKSHLQRLSVFNTHLGFCKFFRHPFQANLTGKSHFSRQEQERRKSLLHCTSSLNRNMQKRAPTCAFCTSFQQDLATRHPKAQFGMRTETEASPANSVLNLPHNRRILFSDSQRILCVSVSAQCLLSCQGAPLRGT